MSLLPIASKIFEKAIYHNLLNYIERENLLNINQSGFRANDSCINQLISITLLFLIYINDLPDGLNSIAKLLADDTSLFSIVQDPNESAYNFPMDILLENAFQPRSYKTCA